MFWKKERKAETTDALYDPHNLPADLLKYEKKERRRPLWSDGEWHQGLGGLGSESITLFIVLAILLLCMFLSTILRM